MSARFATAAVVAALVALAVPAGALAQDVTVNSELDTPPNGCTSDPGGCTLREAVLSMEGDDAINLPAGHYRLTRGEGLALAADMEIRGAGARTTTIDATGTSRVGYVGGPFAVNVTVIGVTVTGGDASQADDPDSGEGGGFRVVDDGELELRDSAVVGNTASDNGGGISSAGEVRIENSLIAGNTVSGGGSPRGGGISIAPDDGRLTMRNSTVSGNTVTDIDGTEARGGGLYVADQLELEHATIAGNTADEGGGLYHADAGGVEPLMSNTLLAGNTVASCAGDGFFVGTDHNLADDDSCVLNGPGDLEVGDAMLAPLGDNGGPTNTHALFSGSPAINGSDNCGDPDQRGVLRGSPPCDIGAFEGSAAIVTTTVDDDDDSCDPTDCTLREALRYSEPDTTIVVPAGDYQLTDQLTSTRGLTINGAGSATKIIGADGERVLSVSSGSLVVRNVRITGGEAFFSSSPRGGGVLVDTDGTLELVDSTVDDNRAGSGGGIWVMGVLDLVRSTVNDNHAEGDPDDAGDGGGIGVDEDGVATLENATVSGNTALRWGGGIYTKDDLVLQNVTVAGNQAQATPSFGAGGGIRQDFGLGNPRDAVTVASNVLIVQNVGFSCGGTNTDPIQSTYGMSDDSPAQPSCNVPPATNTLVPDAKIAPLASNGGPTRTHALFTGSPAIDAGDALCPQTDQRGTLRPVGAACDIGAFEGSIAPPSPPLPPAPPAPPQPSPQELPPPVAGKSVNAETKSGTVKIKLPGTNKFVVLGEQQLPVGTIVDATKGRVTLVAAANKSGGTATADFYEGIFKIGQTKDAKPITTLTLVEKLSCPKRGKTSAAAKTKKRRLWGDGKGKFRTSGSYSSATVRGTKWLVEDSCTSTLTKVARGSVTVRDFAKKKNVIVKAGRKYVAKRKR